MHRPALPFVAALMLAAGCSSGDETDSALKPGQVVVVGNPDGARLDAIDLNYPKLAPGVRLSVGHDPGEWVQVDTDHQGDIAGARSPNEADEIRRRGPYRHKPGDKGPQGQPLSGTRPIKVTVESGPHAGASGTVYRQDVRPVP